ncbi:Recombinase [Rhodopirellula maiorica SM1]|uniref:Recombinase n=1 Tax=Rhodopirellula maiorica SM1 TaxID=1265738 RepID=M5RIB7_9BACT|nr:recombinase family protein [Rhodopirellula maiorica]EMI19058.1 Recombinase [Rhodopirellula maiorica SM1]
MEYDRSVLVVFTNKGEINIDNFTDFLTVACDANSANDYVLSMSRSVVRGQHEKKAARGLWVGGTTPFGLDYVRKGSGDTPNAGEIILGSPEDVQTVRLIFQWYQEGYSHRGIIEKLRDERGLKRTQNFIQRMLINPFYAGDYRWNRKTRGRFHALRDGRVTDDFTPGVNEEKDMVFIPDNHPAIIDRETWTRVQHLVAERTTKTTPFRNGGVHLLTGLCRCAKCGKGFSGSRYEGKNGAPARLMLTCNGHRHKQCRPNYVNQRDVVASIVASLDAVIRPERIESLRAKFYESVAKRRNDVDLSVLERSLARKEADYRDLRAKIKKLPADLLEDFAGDLREQKAEIGKTKEAIADAIAAKRNDGSESVKFNKQLSMMSDIVGALKEALAEIIDTEPRLVRELLASMVDHVTLDVQPRQVSDKHTRYELKSGEITLKPEFNLICAS